MADPLAVVQAQVDAFNAHDVEAFLDTYAADATVDGLDPERPVTGHAALRALYGPRFADGALRCDVPWSQVVAGRWVVAHEHVVSAAGAAELVAVFEVAGERIVHAQLSARHPLEG
jgi:hypothetical protein